MDSNNAILFTFGFIFLLIGTFSPIINNDFDNDVPQVDTDDIDSVSQTDITATNSIQILSGIFFWVFGAPFWINILLTMMRLIFWLIVYDKIRGI